MPKYKGSTPMETYAYLLNYPDKDEIDVKKLAEDMKISVETVGGLLRQLGHNPNIYLQLIEEGYLEEQIPAWVARPKEEKAEEEDFQEEPEIRPVSPRGLQQPIQPRSATRDPPLKEEEKEPTPRFSSSPAKVFKNADEKQAFLHERGVVETDDGRYLKPVTIEGRIRYIETSLDELGYTEFDPEAGMDLGKRAFEMVTTNVMAIARKVALNPTTYQLYSAVVQMPPEKLPEGVEPFRGDFADWLNFAVRFAAKYLYGIEPMLITGQPTLIDFMREAAPTRRMMPA